MQVTATVDAPLVFAGDKVKMSITFEPAPNSSSTTSGVSLPGVPPLTPIIPGTPVNESEPGSPSSINSESDVDHSPILLSGYAAVQGSFKLGDMIISDNFAETRKKGIVLGHHGFEYGTPSPNGQGLFAGVLGGLKQLMVQGKQNSSYEEVDEGDYPIFTTAQTLLFTDLVVDKSQKFELMVDIPKDVPPSYRSRSIFITYHLIIGFQSLSTARNQSSSRLHKLTGRTPTATRLFLPFRIYSRNDTPYDLQTPIITAAPELVGRSSKLDLPPFDLRQSHPVGSDNAGAAKDMADDDAENGMDAFIAELLDNPSGPADRRRHSTQVRRESIGQNTQVSFDISRAGTAIATLILSRPSIRVGDPLTGIIKLVRPCLQIGAYLELGETITQGDISMGTTGPQTIYQAYARQSLGTFALDEVALFLPSLASITPKLDIVQIKANWSLRLDFVGLVGTAFGDKDDDDLEGLVAKGQVDCELFSCRIPLNILPPDSGGHGAAKIWAIY